MESTWVWVVGSILSAFALTGNGFVIFLVVSMQRLHCPTNWLLLSLSLADFGVSLTLLPVRFFCGLRGNCHGVSLAISQFMFMYASVTNLCTLTIDRYVAIVRPFIYLAFQSKKRVRRFVFAAWAVPVVFCLLPLTFIYTDHTRTAMIIFTYPALIIFELLPQILLLFLIGHMVVIVRRHKRETATMITQLQYNQAPRERGNNPSPRRHHTGRGGSSIMFIASVVIFFVFCYSVVIGMSFCYVLQFCTGSDSVRELQYLLLVANSGFNPLAYAFLKQDIKKEVKKLLHFASGDQQNQRFQFRLQMEQR